jgi:tetratricopeptide (TPR) repeat protein
VLPLANMTGDPAREYFADGMTEALITELAGIRSLKVISRTSVMRFKKTDKTLPEIARQLGVEVVGEGSVARGGGRVRVTAQLIRAASDEHLWAERDSRAALEAWRRAFDLDPSDSGALSAYAAGLAKFDAGPEPERMMRKAVELDPLAQFPRCVYKGWLYGQRRYAEAEAQARTTLDLDPHWFWAWDQLWRIHVRQGKLADAQEESRNSWEVVFGETFKPPPGLSWEAYERWLENYLGGQHRSWVSGFLAANCARRGEKQKALAYLETASKE